MMMQFELASILTTIGEFALAVDPEVMLMVTA